MFWYRRKVKQMCSYTERASHAQIPRRASVGILIGATRGVSLMNANFKCSSCNTGNSIIQTNTHSLHNYSLDIMDNDEEWNVFLKDHPIFTLPKSVSGPSGKGNISLELSLNTLPSFTELDPNEDGPTPSGRRQVMVIKDADLLVAAGNEVRIASLAQKGGKKSYKVCMSLIYPVYNIQLIQSYRYCTPRISHLRFTQLLSTQMPNYLPWLELSKWQLLYSLGRAS